MSPGFAVFILMNNYFHDVATAMLLATAFAMRLMLKKADGAVEETVRRLAKNMILAARFSVVWIVAGAVPRILTFGGFEWENAVQTHHEAGLIAKYLIAAAIMIAGAYLWTGLMRDMRLRKLI